MGHESVTTPKPLKFHNFVVLLHKCLSENEAINLELK